MRKIKRILRSVLVFAVLVLLLVPIVPKVKVIMELSQRKEILQKESQRLHAENLDLQAKLKEAKSLDTVEKIAREKLHMVKKGETYVVETAP